MYNIIFIVISFDIVRNARRDDGTSTRLGYLSYISLISFFFFFFLEGRGYVYCFSDVEKEECREERGSVVVSGDCVTSCVCMCVCWKKHIHTRKCNGAR